MEFITSVFIFIMYCLIGLLLYRPATWFVLKDKQMCLQDVEFISILISSLWIISIPILVGFVLFAYSLVILIGYPYKFIMYFNNTIVKK